MLRTVGHLSSRSERSDMSLLPKSLWRKGLLKSIIALFFFFFFLLTADRASPKKTTALCHYSIKKYCMNTQCKDSCITTGLLGKF